MSTPLKNVTKNIVNKAKASETPEFNPAAYEVPMSDMADLLDDLERQADKQLTRSLKMRLKEEDPVAIGIVHQLLQAPQVVQAEVERVETAFKRLADAIVRQQALVPEVIQQLDDAGFDVSGL